MNKSRCILCLLSILYGCSCLAQEPASTPSPTPFPNATSSINSTFDIMRMPSIPEPTPVGTYGPSIEQQNAMFVQDAERRMQQGQQNIAVAENDIAAFRARLNYSLPSKQGSPGAEFYNKAFDKIIASDSLHSIKDNVFTIENAYAGNQLDKAAFDKIIANSKAFLISAMKERGYDLNSNTDKNYMLFQFFSETLRLKKSQQKHLPFTYDFKDYAGINDYSKMFVTKLLQTGSGQCHSLPLLYLILADAIGAEAYLALSPNHSYIRFPDDHGKWYNIELTNGMFSTTSYILQSGYIKSEALQNKIYMQNLTRKQMQAQQLTDLAEGYIHKYGYDDFVGKVIDRALALYPNSISANMVKANLDAVRFEYFMKQVGIDPRDNKQLQKIRAYPKAVELLKEVNGQNALIDNLGYEEMPDEAYQKWLQAMKTEKQTRENEAIKKQFKGLQSGIKTKLDQ